MPTEEPVPEVQEELLTVTEAAGALRIHPNTLRTLIKRGEIPAARIGNQYRIRREALDVRLVELEQVGTTSDAVRAAVAAAPPLTAEGVAVLQAAGFGPTRGSAPPFERGTTDANLTTTAAPTAKRDGCRGPS